MIKIKKITILENYHLKLLFENNEIKIFDLNPYLNKGVFKELKDKDYFKLVKNKGYYIEWPNEQDLSSDTLFFEGVKAYNLAHVGK